MRVAFFGSYGSFDFSQIGGTDSLVRRLSLALMERGERVDYVHYGARGCRSRTADQGIRIREFHTLREALANLADRYDHVVSIYLLPRDRWSYARFRRAHRHSMRFHHVYACWHESPVKRQLLFAEARLCPFNGTLFCVSPRIHRSVSRWAPRAALVLPPVPESYFCKPEDKPNNAKLRLTYAGRVDPGKGTERAVEVFEHLCAHESIETRLCGFAWSHRPETVALHERLLTNPHIRYEPVDYRHWSLEVDAGLCRILRDTDVLLLPYEKLSSTIDAPLLLLEGMANLCGIITPPWGDLHYLYGNSPFNLSCAWGTAAVVDLIERLRGGLMAERRRLAARNNHLPFRAKKTTSILRSALLDAE